MSSTLATILAAPEPGAPPAGGIPNPLSGVSPGWGPFSGLADNANSLLSAVWMIAIVWAAVVLVWGLAQLRKARSGGYGAGAEEGNQTAINGAIRLAAVAAAPALIGVALTLLS